MSFEVLFFQSVKGQKRDKFEDKQGGVDNLDATTS